MGASSAVLTSDAIWHYWTWSDLISGQIRFDVPQRGQIRSDLDQIRSNQDQVRSGQIRIRSDPIKIRSDQVRSDQIQWDQIRSGPMRKDLTWSWPDLTWSTFNVKMVDYRQFTSNCVITVILFWIGLSPTKPVHGTIGQAEMVKESSSISDTNDLQTVILNLLCLACICVLLFCVVLRCNEHQSTLDWSAAHLRPASLLSPAANRDRDFIKSIRETTSLPQHVKSGLLFKSQFKEI